MRRDRLEEVVVAVAAGNSGPGPSSVSDIGSTPDAISVGAIENDRMLDDSVTPAGGAPLLAVPGKGADPGTVITGPLFDVTPLDSTSLACSPLASGSATGMVVLILRGTCNFSDKINNAAAGGALAAIIYNNRTTDPFRFGGQAVSGANLPTLFMSFGIFLMRQHVASAIPDDYLEAARIDGASEWWILLRVIAPLSVPALSAIGIFAFIQGWAAFIWPLLVANDQLLFNMEVGLTAFQFKFSSDYGKLMAGSVISTVPMLVIFLILRRRIIESVALTGLKG